MEEKIVQASRRKYHFIYRITCLITKKFYIGMHSTDNLEDRIFWEWKIFMEFHKKTWKRKP